MAARRFRASRKEGGGSRRAYPTAPPGERRLLGTSGDLGGGKVQVLGAEGDVVRDRLPDELALRSSGRPDPTACRVAAISSSTGRPSRSTSPEVGPQKAVQMPREHGLARAVRPGENRKAAGGEGEGSPRAGPPRRRGSCGEAHAFPAGASVSGEFLHRGGGNLWARGAASTAARAIFATKPGRKGTRPAASAAAQSMPIWNLSQGTPMAYRATFPAKSATRRAQGLRRPATATPPATAASSRYRDEEAAGRSCQHRKPRLAAREHGEGRGHPRLCRARRRRWRASAPGRGRPS